MSVCSQFIDQLKAIFSLMENNIKNSQTKIQSQHRIYTELYRIFYKQGNKLATVANTVNEQILQASNQDDIVFQYYQILSNSLLRLADCSRRVSLRFKSQILDPLKTFNQNYQNVCEQLRKKCENKINQLIFQQQQMIRQKQTYITACQKFEKHKQMQKKIIQKIQNGNLSQLQKSNLNTKRLTENITSSQKYYLSSVQKLNATLQNSKKDFNIVNQSLSYNQDSRNSFFKKTIVNSIKTLQQFANAYDHDIFKKIDQASKLKSNKYEQSQFKKMRIMIQKAIDCDLTQKFVSFDEMMKNKKKKLTQQDTSHLNEYFSKLKQKQKRQIKQLIDPWFLNTRKNSQNSSQIQQQKQVLSKSKSSSVISNKQRNSQKKQQVTRQLDDCRQKILSVHQNSLYFIESLYNKIVEMKSFYCKINEDQFLFLLNSFTVITKNIDTNSDIGIQFTYKMMIISQRIMLKKAQIISNNNHPIQLLCQPYGKNVAKFKQIKFISKLLNYIEKRKTKKKKQNNQKSALGIAKGLFSAFTTKKVPILNEDEQYNCLQQMINIVANFSIPNQIILPFIKQTLNNAHQSSYEYLKGIIINKKDVEERQSLFYRKQIKQKKQQLLKKAIQNKKMGVYVIKLVAQHGFLGKQQIKFRLLCKQLKQIHLDILARLPFTTEQKWIHLIPIDQKLNYIEMKQEVAENSVPSAIQQIITLDVNRSLHLHGQSLNPTILHSLLRIYAYFHTDISYCQGMNYLAGYIYIKTKNQENTYRIFEYLMSVRFKQIFINEFQVLKIKMFQFQRLLAIFHPQISDHFKRQSISSQCYIVSWIITLFASSYQYTMSSFLIDFLWQRFIIWGWPQFFRFVLWIFSLYKEDLVQLTYDRALHFLGELGRSQLFLADQKKYNDQFLKNMGHPLSGIQQYQVSQQLLNKLNNEYKLDQ